MADIGTLPRREAKKNTFSAKKIHFCGRKRVLLWPKKVIVMTETAKIILDLSDMKESGIYNNGDVAILQDIKEVHSKVFVTGFYLVGLCTAGKAVANISGTKFEIRTGDLFIGMPNNIIESTMMSVDFKCCCICLRIDYLERILPITGQNWQIRLMFEQNPVAHLSEDEISTFLLYFNLICSRINHSSAKYLKQVIDALLVAFMYDSRGMTDSKAEAETNPFSSKEAHFKAFIEMITNSFPKSRSVQYYADQLYITPKYLSSICKSISGKPATKIIGMYMEKDIEYQLCHTRKSIKEIASLLGFPSVSFFGKYVKTAFGKSPKAIRDSATMSKQEGEA